MGGRERKPEPLVPGIIHKGVKGSCCLAYVWSWGGAESKGKLGHCQAGAEKGELQLWVINQMQVMQRLSNLVNPLRLDVAGTSLLRANG